MTHFNDFLNEQLQVPVIKAEYDAFESEFSMMQTMIDVRKEKRLTQHNPEGVIIQSQKDIRK